VRKIAAVVVLVLAASWIRSATTGLPAATGSSAQTAAAPRRSTLALSGAWALYPLAVRWQEEFQKTHPGATIDVQAGGAGKGIADALAGIADVGMVSREINPAEVEKGAVALAVAKDAVVAVISAKNPFRAEILERGFKREDLVAIWMRGTATTWEGLLGRAGRTPVHVFTRSDACGAAETWAAYLGGHQEDLGEIGRAHV
jgi:phosphate transport system substrate-binding protein